MTRQKVLITRGKLQLLFALTTPGLCTNPTVVLLANSFEKAVGSSPNSFGARRARSFFTQAQPLRKQFNTTTFAANSNRNTMLKHREFTVPVAWGELACQEWQSQDNTVSSFKRCLLLHGWQDNSNSFVPLIKNLPEEYQYVGVDLSGHGLSSPKGAGAVYNLADYVVDVRMLINHLNWTSYAIIGHSMGGAIAQIYAALYPDEIEHIVSIDIIKPLSSRAETIVASMRRAVDGYAEWRPFSTSVSSVSEIDAHKPPATGERHQRMYTYQEAYEFYYNATRRILSPDSVKLLLARNLKEVDQQTAPNGNFEKLFAFRRDKRIQLPGTFRYSDEQIRWLMKDVKFPMFIIRVNDRAPFEPQEDEFLEYYKATLKNLVFRRIDGHHHVHMDDPVLCGELISKFLRGKLQPNEQKVVNERKDFEPGQRYDEKNLL